MKKKQVKKKCLYARYLAAIGQYALTAEDDAWQSILPVAREFGSPDYERLATPDEAGSSVNSLLDSTD